MRHLYIPLHPKAREIMKAHFVQPDLRYFKEDHYEFLGKHSTLTPMGRDEKRLYINYDYKIITLRGKGAKI